MCPCCWCISAAHGIAGRCWPRGRSRGRSRRLCRSVGGSRSRRPTPANTISASVITMVCGCSVSPSQRTNLPSGASSATCQAVPVHLYSVPSQVSGAPNVGWRNPVRSTTLSGGMTVALSSRVLQHNPAGLLAAVQGPACLTFHAHPAIFTVDAYVAPSSADTQPPSSGDHHGCVKTRSARSKLELASIHPFEVAQHNHHYPLVREARDGGAEALDAPAVAGHVPAVQVKDSPIHSHSRRPPGLETYGAR